MRTRTVVIGSALAFAGVGVSAVFVPVDDVNTLVREITKGTPALPDDPVEVVLADIPLPADAEVLELDALTLAQLDAVGVDDREDAPDRMDLLPTPDPGSPFVGAWAQESRVGGRVIRIRLSLADDGRYAGVAEVFPVGAPADAAPDRTIRTGGVWEERAGGVVLSRMESDAPEVLPMGWREVYWDSVVEAGEWVYTDADGMERALIRSRSAL
ncbi:MAG: hypothetical protein AAGH64_07585 [Planctomycetota bacterium]